MAKTETDRTFGLLWLMPIILIFAVGGSLQYLGLLSQTQSNWIAIFLFSHVFFRVSGWAQIRYEWLLFVFIFFVLLDFFRHNQPLDYTITYIYYITCTIIAAVSGRIYASRIADSISTDSFLKVAKWFLATQLFVVSLQSLFTEQFISLARAPIGYIDAIFGTFFLQSDAALAAVCQLLTISSFFLYCRFKDRVAICTLSLAIIFLGNSNTAKVAIILLIVLLLAYSVHSGLKFGRYAFNMLLAIFLCSFSLIIYSSFSGFLGDFFTEARGDYYHRESWETASRFSPLGQMFAEGINLFGNGALTYYNPITKKWLYNAGFSTFYSLYLDFGVLGLILYYLYQFVLIFRLTRNYLEMTIFLCVFVLFMIFNFALTDLAFTFAFNATMYLNYLRGRSSPLLYYNNASPASETTSESLVASRMA